MNLRYLMVGCLTALIPDPASAQFREGFRTGVPEVRGVVKLLDIKANSLVLGVGEGRGAADAEKTFTLAKNVEIAIGAGPGRVGALKEGKLTDLVEGTRVGLSLSKDQKLVESIGLELPVVRAKIKEIDAEKKTLTLTTGGRDGAADERSYAVATDAEIAVDDGRGKRFSIREVKLGELARGAYVMAVLSIDKKQIHAVVAEGPSLSGTIKSVDLKKKALTILVRSPEGEAEQVVSVSNDATILLDDGKGRRLSLKAAKLEDVAEGATVQAKLSMEQHFAMMVRIEGGTVVGILKAIDADKGTVTVLTAKSREDREEKTFTLAKDGRVLVDGAESKLADLKIAENGPFVQLRLTLDRMFVQSLVAQQPRDR